VATLHEPQAAAAQYMPTYIYFVLEGPFTFGPAAPAPHSNIRLGACKAIYMSLIMPDRPANILNIESVGVHRSTSFPFCFFS
jgi:hypothetical protein